MSNTAITMHSTSTQTIAQEQMKAMSENCMHIILAHIRPWFWFAVLAAIGALITAGIWLSQSTFGLGVVIGGISAAVLIAIGYGLSNAWTIKHLTRTLNSHENRGGIKYIEISAQGYRAKSDCNSFEFSWRAIDRIIATDNAVLLMVGFSVEQIATANIPSDMTKESFVAQLESWREAFT